MKPTDPNSTCLPDNFQNLFIEISDGLRNFIYYKSGNGVLAQDICQESFLRLWKNCAKVPMEKAKSFLYTIANNLFLDNVKHKQVVLKFQENPVKSSTNQSPEFLLEEKEFKSKLENAISQLPENQRIVFLMNRIDKKTYKEIAEELELSVKAVEKRMHKALVELRKLTLKI